MTKTRTKKKIIFWNKQDSVSDKIVKVLTLLGFLIIFGLVGVAAHANGWFRQAQDGATIEKESFETSVSERYEVSAINDSKAFVNLSFILDINGNNQTINVGEFGLDYMKSTVYYNPSTPAENSATVVYFLPKGWLLNQTQAEASYVIIDKRKQSVRGDPTFYKGKDYPESLLIDRIELHVDAVKVYQYEGYNETAYNFVFSAYENNTQLDIIDFRIEGNNLMRGVQPYG